MFFFHEIIIDNSFSFDFFAVDYYVPLTASWIPYHFLFQSLSQLNALLLSVTVFLVLPTYRWAGNLKRKASFFFQIRDLQLP